MRPNFYSTCGLDRAETLRNDPQALAARLADPRTRFLPLWRLRSLVDSTRDGAVPHAVFLDAAEIESLRAVSGPPILLGLDAEDRAYLTVDLSALEQPDHDPALAGRGHFADLRSVGPLMPHDQGALLAYARALVFWNACTQYCSLCGTATESLQGGHQRRCSDPDCASPHFPRSDPAVIMLVHDGGERCVLGRQRNWPPGMHSTLAGFVEAGESLEEAVIREVREEVGLEVTDLAYHSSQPWPFPASLMLGFQARVAYRALQVDPDELESARWFTRASLLTSPEDESFRLPRKDSIARRLIEDWLGA
jgi:NAD+ diphosphatase